MKPMRLPIEAGYKWLAQAPRWTALLLGGLIAVDTLHLAWQLRAQSRPRGDPHALAPRVALSQNPALDPQRIAGAHLFGVDAAAARATAETQRHLTLSGVIATSDPNDGYAILGEPGQVTRLYRTGAALASLGAGTLYQVFADHVVLDVDGRRETLTLPRQHLKTPAPVRVAALEVPPASVAPDAAMPKLISEREDAPSAAEGWFSNLNARPHNADGRSGLELHPGMRLQRLYGLRDGDMVTAVNGVPAVDEDAVNNLLRAGGKTIALTLTRNGVEETRRFPVDE